VHLGRPGRLDPDPAGPGADPQELRAHPRRLLPHAHRIPQARPRDRGTRMKPAVARAARRPRAVEIATDGVPLPRGAARLSAFCATALRAAGYSTWDVSILLCGDERMTALNSRYRGKTSATDVLSFPADEGSREGPVRGDIAVSLHALSRNA